MFIDRNAIFMQAEIKQRFSELYQLIDDALLEFKLRIQDINAPVNAYNEFVRSEALARGKAVYDQLEQLIHARLWSST
jgi:hypothetical protein